MEDRPKEQRDTEFSPSKAIWLSLPLFILASVFIGPFVWDVGADMVGWKGPNIASIVRSWFLGSALISPVVIAMFICCPKAVKYCGSTKGHDRLRVMLELIHYASTVLMVVGFFTLVLFVVMQVIRY